MSDSLEKNLTPSSLGEAFKSCISHMKVRMILLQVGVVWGRGGVVQAVLQCLMPHGCPPVELRGPVGVTRHLYGWIVFVTT